MSVWDFVHAGKTEDSLHDKREAGEGTKINRVVLDPEPLPGNSSKDIGNQKDKEIKTVETRNFQISVLYFPMLTYFTSQDGTTFNYQDYR